MAQVDFSNAHIDTYGTKRPMVLNSYFQLLYTPALYDVNENVINTNQSSTILTNTPTKVSILWTGTFTASGTEIYIDTRDEGGYYSDSLTWKISNISFSSGDTYSFVIEIETSGNT